MKATIMKPISLLAFAATLASGVASFSASAQTPLANQPVLSAAETPGNLALALSVEFPTAVSVAHISATYDSTREFKGFFDPAKCYVYRASTTDSTTAPNTAAPDSYFYPDGTATNHACVGKWSGNFLNWATMQTIDPFRWALTGGARVIDTPTLTVIEKAWASGQGGTGNFPNRTLVGTALIGGATPLAFADLNLRVEGMGNRMRFYSTGAAGAAVHYQGGNGDATLVYDVFVRAKVCDSSASAGGLEANCRAYGSNYKPEGLIQQYANKIRYSAFGYLNDSNILRDGGVLRARQKFVGPTSPVPGSPAITNASREWDPATGVFVINPDATDASDTAAVFGVPIANSGVMNYLNKFGRSGNYKTYDPVGELYYAAVRYFKNLGNVPEWTNIPNGTGIGFLTEWADGFPVITSWDDPILYSCQKNFILGIGDANTHADANVPGSGTPTGNEPGKPTAVSSDTSVDAVVATNRVGTLQGIANLGAADTYNGCCNNNTALMAGLAYDSHTVDIRPDVAADAKTLGKQTIDTYWLDVMEYRTMKSNNQFLLAAKYGGFNVPAVFNPYTHSTALPVTWWSTTTDLLPDGTPRPDNYFTAGDPDRMISGLRQAFSAISDAISAYTTSFSVASPQITSTDNASFAARYDGRDWTGEVTASLFSFDTTGAPLLTPVWNFSDRLATQAGGTGWNTNRRIATWNPVSGVGVPFRHGNISTAQQTALDTPLRASDDSSDFLNYLRGDTTHELGSLASGSSRAYRTRNKLLGDIVDAKLVVVGKPSFPYSDTTNPGYGSFKATWNTRRTVVYAGANDGMLHAINGATATTPTTTTSGVVLESDANAGSEMFAYVPSQVFTGPNNTPSVDGLAALGNPTYVHKYFVNATPVVQDIDLDRTVGANTGTSNWRTILIGGLGKGGKGYYALDVTDPASMVSGGETTVASKVLWEFTDADLGYTFDGPVVAKTRKYGWVVVFGSGYNNANGQGYIFFVNPRTGALLEKVSTGVGSVANSAGLAYVNGYVLERGDGTMDSVYAGDLLGNVWRLDVTAASGAYPAPMQIARLTDPSGNPQPVTSRPIVEIQPYSNKRYVFVGTGRLLDTTDMASSQVQTFYAISDGNNVRFNASNTDLPSGVSFPITRTTLAAMTDPLAGVAVNPLTQVGWYHDLGLNPNNIGWRVITEPTAFFGQVSFASMVPTNQDVCRPSGESRFYVVDFETGQTRLLDRDPEGPNGNLAIDIPYLSLAGVITDSKIFSESGKAKRILGLNDGSGRSVHTRPLSSAGLQRVNWREIPVVD